jgi:cyclopropane-fatty-acyl-phospholipid synthase
MGILELEDMGRHYAHTLAAWRERLLRNADRVRELGYTDEFLRLWEYYFSYCEGGFWERQISVVQMVLARPRYRPKEFPVEGSP